MSATDRESRHFKAGDRYSEMRALRTTTNDRSDAPYETQIMPPCGKPKKGS